MVSVDRDEWSRQFINASTSHLDTSLTIPIRPPNTTVSKPLLLPNLDLLLHFLQTFLPSPPSSLPVSRRHSNQNTFLFDINLAQPMRHSNRHKPMLLTDGASNGLQRAQSQRRVGRVCEVRHCFAVEGITGATYKKNLLFSLLPGVSEVVVTRNERGFTGEQYYGACFGTLYTVHYGFGVEVIVGQRDVDVLLG
jgi:hypothetical protein